MIQSTKVLVADDFQIIRKIHVTNLKKLGIENIQEVTNGKEALEAAGKTKFDLILLDWYMPIMTGLEALKAMREKGIETPIVFCTDEVEQESVNQAMGLGVSDYIKKPYSPTQFKTIISKALGLPLT